MALGVGGLQDVAQFDGPFEACGAGLAEQDEGGKGGGGVFGEGGGGGAALGDDEGGFAHAGGEDFEAGGRVEQGGPGGVGEAPEIPGLVVQGPGLVGGEEADGAGFEDAVEFEDELPGHQEMFEDGERHDGIEAVGGVVAREGVSVTDDVDVGAWRDVEAAVGPGGREPVAADVAGTGRFQAFARGARLEAWIGIGR